jgi:ribosomal-protein-alanine N-acetyltransferase
VAWVRLATLDDGISVEEWLDLALPPVLERLRRLGTRTLAWMDYGGWAGSSLRSRSFGRLTEVITLAKYDGELPEVQAERVCLRPASAGEMSAVAAVDRASFSPHWWHSEATMRRRAAVAAHFVVAEVEGQVVGYAEGQFCLPLAHLNRIAVHPRYRGQGIGALLLQDALRAFWRRGADRITLNTQVDNHDSQRLYRRFGFEPTGDSTTAWELTLQ